MNDPDSVRRRAWAQRMIGSAGGPIPRYGSAIWSRLPETDRRRVAAVVLAAEAWARYSEDIEVRLEVEISAARQVEEARAAAEFAEMAAGVRRLASVPSFAEISERRGEPERAERSRDHARAMRAGWNA